MTDPRLARPAWRGRTNVDALTIAAIERAEQLGSHTFVVSQGSYQSGVAASAGTHDRGGVVDLGWCGHDACVRALREAGMAAWHRTPAQGPWRDHIHVVVIGHPNLAPAAARQVAEYRVGRNGLANRYRDDGPRVNPIPVPVFPWPPVVVVPEPSRGGRVDAAEQLLVDAIKVAVRTGRPRRARVLRASLAALRKIAKR